VAEAAAARIRAGRSGSSGAAMRLPAVDGSGPQAFTPQQRLLLLDTWIRSGLPAGDFGALVGVARQTLYMWKRRFEESGPAGLEDHPRGGPSGSRMPEVTRRAILMLKQSHPEYGCERISDLLARGPALPASAGSVAKVLREAGYAAVESPTQRHPPKARRFERAAANSLWQTDLFTFVLKRQNRRLHLAAFMDDYSRFIVGWGLFSSPSTELVVETLKSAVSSFQAPAELLTDNGPQYVTWRGKSKFAGVCVSLGIRQIVARPRRPQTLGKVERFWGTLWREFLAAAIFADVSDARRRIGKFVDYYNFQRPHQSLDGLSPADRYFGRSAEVKDALRKRLDENALRLARRMDELESLPLTPDGSLDTDSVVDEIPVPGVDPLSAGLSAAAGGMEDGHEEER
jgi:transposase InsO family protein